MSDIKFLYSSSSFCLYCGRKSSLLLDLSAETV